MSIAKRIQELVTLAKNEGIKLPYSPEVIVGLEDKGFYVDLNTGLCGSDQETFSVTVIGEAEIIAALKGDL